MIEKGKVEAGIEETKVEVEAEKTKKTDANIPMVIQ
jgi:hypothetical protein